VHITTRLGAVLQLRLRSVVAARRAACALLLVGLRQNAGGVRPAGIVLVDIASRAADVAHARRTVGATRRIVRTPRHPVGRLLPAPCPDAAPIARRKDQTMVKRTKRKGGRLSEP